MAPYNTPFPYNPQDSGLVIAYRNGEMIADLVCPFAGPQLSVKTFEWWRFDFSQHVTVPDTRIGRTSRANQVQFSAQKQAESTEDYALGDTIPIADQNAASATGSYDPVQHAQLGIMDLLILDREIRVANLLQNPATYPSANVVAVSGTSRFNNAASDPIRLIRDFLETFVIRPTHGWIGRTAYNGLISSPGVLEAYHGQDGASKGVVPKSFILEQLELQDLYVGSSFVNSARPGQTMALGRTWGRNMGFFVKDQLADPVMNRARATFAFTARQGDRRAGRMADEKAGLDGSTYIQVGWSVKELVAAPDLGGLLQNVID